MIKSIMSFICFVLPSLVLGQGNYFVTNYFPGEYHGGLQSWDIKVDSNNIVWVANQDGLLSYNGQSWSKIRLPFDKMARTIDFSSDGRLYVGGVSEFGYVEKHSTIGYKYHSLSDSIYKRTPFNDIWSAVSVGENTVFLSDNYLFIYHDSIVTTIKKSNKFFYLAFHVDDHIFIQEMGGGLFLLNNMKLEKVKNSELFKTFKIHSIVKIDDRYIFTTKKHGLYSVELSNDLNKIISIKPFKTDIDQELKNNNAYQTILIGNYKIAIASTISGMYIINYQGHLIHHFDIDNQLTGNAVYNLTSTTNGVIWIAQDMGISKIEYGLPITYWNHLSGLYGTINMMDREKNTLYASTTFGIYALDLKHQSRFNKFFKLPNIYGQSWDLYQYEYKNKNLLLSSNSDGVYVIEDRKARKIISIENIYKLFQCELHPELLFLGAYNGMYIYKYHNGNWNKVYTIKNLVNTVRDIAEDKSHNVWFAANYRGFFKLSDKDLKQIIDNKSISQPEILDTTRGFKSLKSIQFFQTDTTLFFYSGSVLYTFDSINNSFKRSNIDLINSNSVELVRKFSNNNSKAIWFDGKNIVKPTDKGYTVDSTTLNRAPFNIITSTYLDGNSTWIGTENGLYNFRYNDSLPNKDNFKIILEKVRVGDNKWFEYYSENTIDLGSFKFSDNTILCNLSVPFYYGNNKTEISYRLEGYDKNFTEFRKQFQIQYKNISSGKYKLKVRVRNAFGIVKTRTVLKFEIESPIYLSIWAFIFYTLAWTLIIIFIIRIRTSRLRKLKIKLENIVKERTIEISERNEEILQQTEALKETNTKLERLSIIAEKTGNAVSIFDSEGNLEWINKGFEQLYGYSFNQYILIKGQTIFENSEYPEIQVAIDECVETKSSVQYEYFTISRKHEGLWIHTTLTPIFDVDQKVDKFVAIDTNITQIKNAEEEVRFQKEELERKSKQLAEKNNELERLSIITRQTDNSVILADRNGEFIWINEGFTRLYGYTLDELKSKMGTIHKLSSHHELRTFINNWPLNETSISYESKNVTKAGATIWTQTTLTPIFDDNNKLYQLIAIDSDITRLKEAEKQIEEQRDQLKALNATKDKFFSIIGHDLRSPFGNFVNLTQIILQNITTFDQATLVEYMGKMHRSAQNSYNLLENLLDWSRQQQGRIKFYPDFYDITEIVEDVAQLLEPLAERKKIKLTIIYKNPVYAFFDEDMIKTVVRNLLFNSLKYTHIGGEISVWFKKDAQNISIFVSDTGIGMTQEEINNLFNVETHFSKLGTDKERGTGLGLILTKDFVERNNGTITVKSKKDVGTTFKITLPSK